MFGHQGSAGFGALTLALAHRRRRHTTRLTTRTAAAAISAAIGTPGLTEPVLSVTASRAADCAACAFSTTTSFVSCALSVMRSLVSAAFCFARPVTSALADNAPMVSPSSLRVCSMSAWMSSIPASGPGSGDGGVGSVVMAGVLQFVDVLFDVRNGHLRGGCGLAELLLADETCNGGGSEQDHRNDQGRRPHRHHQRQRGDRGGDHAA